MDIYFSGAVSVLAKKRFEAAIYFGIFLTYLKNIDKLIYFFLIITFKNYKQLLHIMLWPFLG